MDKKTKKKFKGMQIAYSHEDVKRAYSRGIKAGYMEAMQQISDYAIKNQFEKKKEPI